LRKIFGPVKDNISVESRRKKNTELKIVFQSTIITKVIKEQTPMGRPYLEESKLIN
jgi:hypothetical protein